VGGAPTARYTKKARVGRHYREFLAAAADDGGGVSFVVGLLFA
jgi:hypothetical protein